MGVSNSTVSRELKRNEGSDGYQPQQAEDLARERLRLSQKCKARHISARAKAWALGKLEQEQWSPQQISVMSRQDCGESISHETIYQWVIADRKAGGSLYVHLRRKQRKYNKRNPSGAGRDHIVNRVDISER